MASVSCVSLPGKHISLVICVRGNTYHKGSHITVTPSTLQNDTFSPVHSTKRRAHFHLSTLQFSKVSVSISIFNRLTVWTIDENTTTQTECWDRHIRNLCTNAVSKFESSSEKGACAKLRGNGYNAHRF